jgi:hypothetical protein
LSSECVRTGRLDRQRKTETDRGNTHMHGHERARGEKKKGEVLSKAVSLCARFGLVRILMRLVVDCVFVVLGICARALSIALTMRASEEGWRAPFEQAGTI